MAPERFVTHHGNRRNWAKAAGGLLASAVLSSLPASCRHAFPRSRQPRRRAPSTLRRAGHGAQRPRASGHGFRSERDAPAYRDADEQHSRLAVVVALPLVRRSVMHRQRRRRRCRSALQRAMGPAVGWLRVLDRRRESSARGTPDDLTLGVVASIGDLFVAEDPAGRPLIVPGRSHEFVAFEHEQRPAQRQIAFRKSGRRVRTCSAGGRSRSTCAAWWRWLPDVVERVHVEDVAGLGLADRAGGLITWPSGCR